MAARTKAELQAELNKMRAQAEELKAQLARQDQRDNFKKQTDTIHDLYQSFVDSGFTSEQAWDLLMVNMTNLHNTGVSAPSFVNVRGGSVR